MTAPTAEVEPVVVRPLTASAADVGALIRRVILETYPAEVASVLAERTVGDGRLERLLAERTFFEALADDGLLVGVAAVHLESGDLVYLSSCFVTRRRCGIGSALLEARLAWARNEGAASAEATVGSWNVASVANLSKVGFVVTGESPDTWSGSGTYLTMVGEL